MSNMYGAPPARPDDRAARVTTDQRDILARKLMEFMLKMSEDRGIRGSIQRYPASPRGQIMQRLPTAAPLAYRPRMPVPLYIPPLQREHLAHSWRGHV